MKPDYCSYIQYCTGHHGPHIKTVIKTTGKDPVDTNNAKEDDVVFARSGFIHDSLLPYIYCTVYSVYMPIVIDMTSLRPQVLFDRVRACPKCA